MNTPTQTERCFPEELSALLTALYPSLNLTRVRWYHGLPWFMSSMKWVSGVTLPHTWSGREICIYLRRWEPSDPEWVALAVHEAYHALQMQEASARYPLHWGTWHPFAIAYIASWTRHGYRRHPLELPAYAYEALFIERFEEMDNLDAMDDPSQLGLLIDFVPDDLICREAGFGYPDEWWRMIPALLLLLPGGLLRLTGDATMLLFRRPVQVLPS